MAGCGGDECSRACDKIYSCRTPAGVPFCTVDKNGICHTHEQCITDCRVEKLESKAKCINMVNGCDQMAFNTCIMQ